VLTVALVSTGHEVLRGHTVNTNASWLARRATEAGAKVTSVRTVGDDLPDLVAALRDALAEADDVVVTGGLGPTEDDRSRDALARVLDVPLEDDAEARAIVARYFTRSDARRRMQWRQVLVPRRAPARQRRAPRLGSSRRRAAAPCSCCRARCARCGRCSTASAPRWRARGTLRGRVAGRLDGGAPRARSPARSTTSCAPRAGRRDAPDDGEVAVRLARGPDATARADAAVAEIVRRLGAHVVSTDEAVRVEHGVVARSPRGSS
jgi:molybdenum cofactor synthesis domain-containing protein